MRAQFYFMLFPDKLHVVPPDRDKDCLPSPEELKGKILIKVWLF
jgi:hypothetical protein